MVAFLIGAFIFLIVPVGFLIKIIKQIDQYERGIKFQFGKFKTVMEPGWRLVIPIIQSYGKVDMRTKAVDVPDQEAMTKDNISVTINAVLYYNVASAEKAILEVENYEYAMGQLAQTTMRNAIGEATLDELLSNREEVSKKIKNQVDTATDPWGISVRGVELKDIKLPADMKRTISKQAEAERERRAVIIKAEGEVQSAENMAKAAGMLAASPGALHLRTLQSINDLSSDQSNTVIFAMPLEILRAFERMGVGGGSTDNVSVKKNDINA
ncbi:MAG: slipin family protein [Parcubacteria group bacterium]|nr:slipin family protein [Parcubacteria group bacterium]